MLTKENVPAFFLSKQHYVIGRPCAARFLMEETTSMPTHLYRLLSLILLALLALPSLAAPQQICRQEEQSAPMDSRWKIGESNTVIDQRLGLQWQRCPLGQSGPDCAQGQWLPLSLMQAHDRLYRLNAQGLAGYHDWRLPTLAELQSLRRDGCVAPSIDLRVFPHTPAVWFWSLEANAKPSNGDGYTAAYLDFASGFSGEDDKNLGNAIRLVRQLPRPPKPSAKNGEPVNADQIRPIR